MHLRFDSNRDHDHTIIVRGDIDPTSLLPGCIHESLFAEDKTYRAFLTLEQRSDSDIVLYGSMCSYNESDRLAHSRIWRKSSSSLTAAEKEFEQLRNAIEARIHHYTAEREIMWDTSIHQDLTFCLNDHTITFSPAHDNQRTSSITRWQQYDDGRLSEFRYREFERDRRIIIDCVSLDPRSIVPLHHFIDVIDRDNASAIASRKGYDFMNSILISQKYH